MKLKITLDLSSTIVLAAISRIRVTFLVVALSLAQESEFASSEITSITINLIPMLPLSGMQTVKSCRLGSLVSFLMQCKR